uniref:Auxin efflux carrier n=1 Tax=Ditylum brightwellii TaxID=49249 RepID=A0A7S4W0L2_9STRA
MSASTIVTSGIPSVGRSAAASAATQSIAELGVASLLGAGCVQQEILTPPMIKSLSKVTVSILLPFFLCTSIIKSVSKYGLSKSQLAVPLLGIIQCSVLYIVTTQLTFPMLGIDNDTDDGRCTAVCCSFGNSGVIPLIFAESLFRQSANADYVDQATAFVSLYLVGWSPFFWSFGRSILIRSDTKANGTISFKEKLMVTFKSALPPPVKGVFIGLLIATTPLCRLFLRSSDGNERVPLAVIFNSVANFGRAASPLSLLILVSSLAVGAGVGNYSTISQKESKQTCDDKDSVPLLKRWAVVSITRFLLSPAVMYGLLSVAKWIDLIGNSNENPMLWFILILEATMPPAQNSVTMLQVADRGEDAALMAMFLFSVYATSMIPVVLVLTLALGKFNLA